MTQLTDAQGWAVERRRGSLLLSATAGSGKTRVLVERFVRAVADDDTPPGRILAITFTEKAAHELRTRIRARLAELGERDAARDAEAAFVSTIHGFCARVLRSDALAAGLDPRFEVLDEAAALRLQDRAFEQALVTFFEREDAVALAAAFGLFRLERAVRAVHELLRSRGEAAPRLPPASARGDVGAARARLAAARTAAARELGAIADPGAAVTAALERLERCANALAGESPSAGTIAALELRRGVKALQSDACDAYNDACSACAGALADAEAFAITPLLDALLAAYGDAYRRLKRARGALDFDDLELEALALLRADDGLRKAWSERFELVMVDEFQDVNPRQAALLELLERDNLFVVGDPLQSIYGFRHADPGLIVARREALAARGAAATLTENFRGRRELLDAVNVAFAPRFGERFVALEAVRETDAAAAPPRVELLVTDTAGADGAAAWRRAEAQLLAERVAVLIGSGAARAGETIVLLRAGGGMATYERALAARGLGTLAVGGGFWNALEVADLRCYLRALANPLDTRALYALLGSPLVGLSADGLALIGLAAVEDPWRAIRDAPPAGLTAADRERLAAFAPRFAADRALAPRLALDVLLERAIAASGYEAQLLAQPGGARRLANVQKLLRIVRRFEAAEGRDLRALLDHLASQAAAAPREPDAPAPEVGDAAVRLMTIHAAKGLEADVVCVADLGRSYGNGAPPLLTDGRRLGLLVPQPDGAAVAALAHDELLAERRAAERAEEDRILYVAMTRARERLLLSGATSLERWGSENGAPLSWLGPALVPQLPQAPGGDVRTGELHLRVALNLPAPAPDARAAASHAGGAAAPWPREAVVARPASAPAALSYSGLSSYASCGYRYYLERILGLPEVHDELVRAPAGGLGARARGTLAHALLERLDLARPAAPPADVVAALAAELGLAPRPDEVEELSALVGGFAASRLCARLAAARGVRREHPFAFVLDGCLVNGYLDVLADERSGVLIVDYKSDRVGDADLELLTERDYGAQRLLYALAGLRAGAPAVEVCHCYLERPDEPASVRHHAADLVGLEQRVRELSAGIAAGRFAVATEPHRLLCAGCPGRARLCSWEPELTGREPLAAGLVS